MPAKVSSQSISKRLDSCFRRNDVLKRICLLISRLWRRMICRTWNLLGQYGLCEHGNISESNEPYMGLNHLVMINSVHKLE